MSHKSPLHIIAVKINEDRKAVDYLILQSIDGYFRSPGWHKVAEIGSNIACDCDECRDGLSDFAAEGMEELIEHKVGELIDDLSEMYTAQEDDYECV
jgi:hypothetical protein